MLSHYLAADYVVTGEGGFVLKVGRYSAWLDALHRRHGVACCAFLTAWNPRSRQRSLDENQRAQQQLAALVKEGGYASCAGRGEDPAGLWPSEDSLLILGIAEPEACALGRQFEQNALLVAAGDAVPRLVWLQEAAAEG